MEILNWVEKWFVSQCDGDWEHENQIQIYTVDNPGWGIKIDLRYTILEDQVIDYELIEKNENDWYGLSIKNKVFNASGDPYKLQFLLEKFKSIVEGVSAANK